MDPGRSADPAYEASAEGQQLWKQITLAPRKKPARAALVRPSHLPQRARITVRSIFRSPSKCPAKMKQKTIT